MNRKRITKLIAYGILIFLIGFFLGLYWLRLFQWLVPLGTIMTFTGVFFFLKNTDLYKEFDYKSTDSFLTFFWDVLAFKAWTFIFMLWMIVMIIEILDKGHI